MVQETIDLTLIDANKENTPNNQNSSNLKNFETNSASVSEKFQDKQDELDKDIFFKYSVNDQRSEEVYNQHMVLSYSLVKELYESILYIPDMHFVLSVAEIIYSKTKLDPKDFVNTNAAFYFANKLNMLIIEIAESIYQIFSKNKIKNVEYATTLYGRIQKIGLKYSEEVLIFSSNESSDQLEEKVSRKGVAESRDIYHQISEGDYVLLSLQSDDEFVSQFINNSNTGNANITSEIIASKEIKNKENSTTMIALVRDIEKDFKIKLMTLPNKFQSDAIMEKDYNWRIIKLNNRSTIEKTIESLETFCTKMTMVSPLYRILLAPPSCDSKMIQQLSEIDAEIPNLNKFPCKTNLNESQQSALNASKKQLLTLIQGPPGTGKTTTAVEIVLEWLRSNPSTILACADSNIAVDILHSEFMKAGIKAIRIGPGYDDKNDFKLDKNYKIYNSYYMTKQFHNANNIRFGIMKRMLQDAQVVCATCVGSTSDFLKGMNFQRVIIDEVTQATEMSTLIPLIRGCHQLVLIGDHKQLPPTVISTFAQSKGMTISLFERLIRQGIKPYLLSTQYRMHPSIALFPSYQFYNHKLINGIGDEHRLMVPGFAWPSNHIRVALINVVGSEQVYSSSIQNPKYIINYFNDSLEKLRLFWKF